MKTLLFIFLLLSLHAMATCQNVGIGTPSPIRGKLVVDGVAGAGATNAIFGNMEAGISMQQNWPTIGFNQYRDLIIPGSEGKYMKSGYAALITLSQDNGIIYLDNYGAGTGGQPTGTGIIGWAVKPTGNMAVGHGNAGAMLDVVRGSNSYAPDGTAAFRGTAYNSHFNHSTQEHTYIRGGKAGSHVFINDIPTGNVFMGTGATIVGINTQVVANSGTLVIDQIGQEGIGLIDNEWGNHRWEINNEHYNSDANAPTSCLTLRYTGRNPSTMGWFRPDNGSYSDNSDMRLKENIQPLQSVIQKLLQLNPSSYRFITGQGASPLQIGLLAQEVKAIFPELVDVRHFTATEESPATDLHGMNYGGLAVIAVKAIQEQQSQIDKLTKQLQQLEAQLAALKSAID